MAITQKKILDKALQKLIERQQKIKGFQLAERKANGRGDGAQTRGQKLKRQAQRRHTEIMADALTSPHRRDGALVGKPNMISLEA